MKGNLGIHFDWGDYAIWHLAPDIKVSMDTRREMAYPDSIYSVNMRHMLGIGSWADLIDDYETDMVLVKRLSPTDNLMQQREDWLLVYQDDTSALFTRLESYQNDQLQLAVQDFNPDFNGTIFP